MCSSEGRISVVSTDAADKKRAARQAAIDQLRSLALPDHRFNNTPVGLFAKAWLAEPTFGQKDCIATAAVAERFGLDMAKDVLTNIRISPNVAATLAAAGKNAAAVYVESVIQKALNEEIQQEAVASLKGLRP